MAAAVMARARWVTTCLLGSLAIAAGCGPRMDLGSDVWWKSTFESGDFGEWTALGGSASAFPSSSNTIKVSTGYAHHGRYAAELSITAGPDGTQQNTGLVLK